ENSSDQRICVRCAIWFSSCNRGLPAHHRHDRAHFHFSVLGGCPGAQSVYRSPGFATGARSNSGIPLRVPGARTVSGNRPGAVCLFPVLKNGRDYGETIVNTASLVSITDGVSWKRIRVFAVVVAG